VLERDNSSLSCANNRRRSASVNTLTNLHLRAERGIDEDVSASEGGRGVRQEV
jgi:hypothetical protein